MAAQDVGRVEVAVQEHRATAQAAGPEHAEGEVPRRLRYLGYELAPLRHAVSPGRHELGVRRDATRGRDPVQGGGHLQPLVEGDDRIRLAAHRRPRIAPLDEQPKALGIVRVKTDRAPPAHAARASASGADSALGTCTFSTRSAPSDRRRAGATHETWAPS